MNLDEIAKVVVSMDLAVYGKVDLNRYLMTQALHTEEEKRSPRWHQILPLGFREGFHEARASWHLNRMHALGSLHAENNQGDCC